MEALRDTPAVRDLVLLAIETACRRGELLTLQWQLIDFDRQIAHLPTTKNGETRDVPLSTQAADLLRSKWTAAGSPDDGQVFALKEGSVTQAFRRACRRAGIKDLRLHDLRHEATSRLFEKGLSVMEVATITGHKTLQMLKRYTHLKAADLVAKLG